MVDSQWGTTPKRSIEVECTARGRDAVVDGCRALVRGEVVDDALLMALAGPAASPFIGGVVRDDNYWPRVWGARGLLWQWHPRALPEIRTALTDVHWRVREMALTVIRVNRVRELLADVQLLADDPVTRVRIAAAKCNDALAIHPRRPNHSPDES